MVIARGLSARAMGQRLGHFGIEVHRPRVNLTISFVNGEGQRPYLQNPACNGTTVEKWCAFSPLLEAFRVPKLDTTHTSHPRCTFCILGSLNVAKTQFDQVGLELG